MQIIHGSRKLNGISLPNPVITLGNFDGVHLGHQKILQKTIRRAQAIGGVSVVYTFNPHPLNVLRPEQEPLKITTFEEKARLIEKTGIDFLICETFTGSFARKPPGTFIRDIICKRIHPREIVIGQDYAFGKNRGGSIELLRTMGEELGFRVHVINDITIKNIPVRSTTLRKLITDGRVSLAQKLLGTDYSISGKVVHGKRRRIGFPTANLSYIKDLVPKNGVYAIRALTPHGLFDGVVSIGYNPTFECEKLCIEAHLFDFDKDIYGCEITIRFVKRIRGEKKFKDVESLVKQIKHDIAFSRRILKKRAEPA